MAEPTPRRAPGPAPGARPLALVTGASTGIGRELARELVERGHDVLAVADEGEVALAAAELSRAGGPTVTPLQADLTAAEGNERVVATVRADGRPLSALALNAGIGVGGPFLETDLERQLDVVRLNVMSTVHLAHRLVGGMVTVGDGRVLITASTTALMPGPLMAVYAATKAFVHSFAEALRHELRDTGVTVTALLPGPTDTEFFERADMGDTRVATTGAVQSDPADVARSGVEAMLAGKDQVVAGLSNKLQVAAARITPEPVKAAVNRRLAERPTD